MLRGIETRYWLAEPNPSPTSDAGVPLLLFLHGGGEGGDDLEKVKTHGPPKLIQQGQAFPFYVASPLNPSTTQFWDDQVLIDLVDHLQSTLPIDPDRIYVTGLSRGGYGAWRLAIQNPDRFAALIPIAGGGAVPYVNRISHVPTWVFHGTLDRSIPIAESQRMVDALQAAGGKVRFTIYPDAEHDSWTRTYANPAVFEWMLQQTRAVR